MNIFVGNLAFSATEEGVRQLFEGYGTVDTVRLATDRDTGRPRGFGFVEMPDTTEARAAIAGLNGTSLDGRTLNVDEARPRDERRGPRRGREHGDAGDKRRTPVEWPASFIHYSTPEEPSHARQTPARHVQR